MIGRVAKVLSLMLALSMAVGCAAEKPAMIPAQDLSPKLADGRLSQKVDNFVIIMDGTASMDNPYKEFRKTDYEKNLVSLLNRTIPNMKLNGAIRTFGDISAWTDRQTALLYGMTQYTRAGMEPAIDKVKTSGNSPLETAIYAAGGDLKGLPGESALIIFSDGEDMSNAPVGAAVELKKIYGDKLCIYTVLIGDTAVGRKLLEKVANAGQCGFFTTGEDIASAAGMAGFVEKVFFGRKTEDAASRKVSITLNVKFDTNKSDVKPVYFDEIKKVADFMKKYPSTRAVIEGHTDSVGKVASNLVLSQRRADAIRKILVEKYGIDGSRLKAVGYGSKKPVASNKTAEGKKKNRRVEAKIDSGVKK